jgi:hypothetical protein
MHETEPIDELLKRAFELAYFILGDRASSIYVAMAAMDKLKTASTSQGRRLYYTPTGRSAYPAARTKVSLGKIHLLQRLVYVESELFERLLEGQQESVRQEDLVIRYIKHLIRITTKHNSFYVTLGLSRLLYNYSTAETSELYNLVLQDPDRMRDDYYYRSRKKSLMQEIKDRFGSLIRTQHGARREERFQPQQNSQEYASLVKECLIRFTPWNSACTLPNEFDPAKDVITEFSFEGEDPDKEHKVELNRIHTLIHPKCFNRLTAALDLPAADKRLELPYFFLATDESRPTPDRFNPAELSERELDAIRRYLDKNAIHRKNFQEGPLRLLIDGMPQTDFDLGCPASVSLNIENGSEFIEIRSVGSIDRDEDTCLAVNALTYGKSGILPSNSSFALGKGRRLSLTILPSNDGFAEGRGATLLVDYQRAAPARIFLSSLRHVEALLYQWTRFRLIDRPHVLRAALGLAIIALGATGLWFYSHWGRSATQAPQLAKLEQGHEEESPPPVSHPAIPPATPRDGNRQPQVSGSSPGQNTAPGDQEKVIEATRGTTSKPASAMLLSVKKVYVDPLGDDSFGQQLREALAKALRTSNRFDLVTNRDEADAVFKGLATTPPTQDSGSSVVLDLVNARGHVVWSLSTTKAGMKTSGDAAEASSFILKILLRDVKALERKR